MVRLIYYSIETLTKHVPTTQSTSFAQTLEQE